MLLHKRHKRLDRMGWVEGPSTRNTSSGRCVQGARSTPQAIGMERPNLWELLPQVWLHRGVHGRCVEGGGQDL